VAQKRLTRERLMAAARNAFQTHGFHGATVDEIAAAAGASRPTFYLHFANKQEVLYALTEADGRSMATYLRELDAALATGSRAALYAWIDRAYDWLETITALVPVWDAASVGDPEVANRGARILDQVVRLVPRYLAGWPAGRRREARLRLILLVFQFEHFGRWSTFPGWEVERELALKVLTDVWWETLRPPPAAERAAG
jgi:AcrR family transcriptional regulator